MEWILCKVVESSCLLTHNIVPHISRHDLPYQRTTKKYENSRSMEVFQFLPRKFAIQTWLCNCPQYLCLIHIVLSAAQISMIKARCWFSQIDFFIGYFPHRIIGFSQIAFPNIVLPKDDHKDFAQEERMGLPCWTMI